MRNLISLAVSLLLAACGANVVQQPANVQTAANVRTSASSLEPQPFSSSEKLSSLGTAPASESVPRALERFAQMRLHSRTPQSVIPAGGAHGYAGIYLYGSGPYTGIYSVHSVYLPNTQLTIPYPSGAAAGGQELIFAPTTKIPNGCLENGSTYFSQGGNQTFAYFYVFDFCGAGGFVYLRGLDASFERDYVRRLEDVPSYVVESMANGSATNPASTWRSLLYNFSANRWDLVYTQTGSALDNFGWSIFEYYFLQGPCPPSLPLMQARQIKLYDPVLNQWVHATSGLSGFQTVTGPGGLYTCFVQHPVSYGFNLVHPDWWWTVTSTGS